MAFRGWGIFAVWRRPGEQKSSVELFGYRVLKLGRGVQSGRPIKQSVKRAQTAVKFPWWDCLAGCWTELLCFPLYQVGRAHWLDFLDGIIILVWRPRRSCLPFCFPGHGRAILGGIALAGSSQNPCFPPKRFFFRDLVLAIWPPKKAERRFLACF